ncbi:MAG: 1-deoxy-D-xylulose-5-phosphate reductoisomerase, partial [Erysipelotrichaceae bacterium]
EELKILYPNTTFFYGDEGLIRMTEVEEYNLLVNALVGFSGFKPTLSAIVNHKDIALANKETLVVAGDLIKQALKENDVTLYPIDSEHSAIFQCLLGSDKRDVKRLIITGSGGSFRDLKRDELKNVSLEDALKHPVWNMGNKITIDSATMMNKGFEIIEAHYLFDIPYDEIDVVLHSESIIHSFVEFKDGSLMAQMSNPDMHLPIQYAILYPRHMESYSYNQLDLGKLGSLHFKEMDYERYPLVKIAKEVGKFGGNLGAVLNAANDKAVELFLDGKISFLDIEKSVIDTIGHAKYIKHPTLDEIMQSHKWAERYVRKMWNQ